MNALTELITTIGTLKQRGQNVISVAYVDQKLSQVLYDNMHHSDYTAPNGRLNGELVSMEGREQKLSHEPRRPPDDVMVRTLPELDHLAHTGMARRVFEGLKRATNE